MDLLGDQLEAADQNFAVDHELAAVDSSTSEGGILTGLAVTSAGGMIVSISVGTAYDASGRRIRLALATTVDLSASGTTAIGAGGTPTGGASTTPGATQERWLSLFLQFDRLLSDPRVDGSVPPVTVFFRRDESFRFAVTQSVDQAAPAVDGARPTLEVGRILLADIRISAAPAIIEIVGAGPSIGAFLGRRQDYIVQQAAGIPVVRGGAGVIAQVRGLRETTLRNAVATLLGYYNDHVRPTGGVDRHAATHISYAGGAAWLDGTTNPAIGAGDGATSGIEGQLDKIIVDLIATVTPNAGSEKIGGAAHTTAARGSGRPTAGAPPAGAPAYAGAAISLDAGALDAQLTRVLNELNRMVRATGDTVQGDLLPDLTANDRGLGNGERRWDAFLDTLDVSLVLSSLTPSAAAGQLLGTGAARWDASLRDLDISRNIVAGASTRWSGGHLTPDNDVQRDLGAVSRRWSAVIARNVLGTVSVGDPTNQTAIESRAPTSDAYIGRLIDVQNKQGRNPFSVNDMGHAARRESFFRDDFMYVNAAELTRSYWAVTFSTGGAPTVLADQDGAVGVAIVSAAGLENSSGLATSQTFRVTVGQGPHFAARARITGVPAAGYLFQLGFGTSAGALRIGFESRGLGSWHVRAFDNGGATVLVGDGFGVDTSIAQGPNTWHYFELRLLTATTIEAVVDTYRMILTTSAAYDVVSALSAVMTATAGGAASAGLQADFIELYRS